MRTIHSEIIVDAPRENVWQVLTDFDRYGEWNRFTPSAGFKPEVGHIGALEVRMNLASEKTACYPEEIKLWKEGYEVHWGVPSNTWYIKSVRIQRLTEVNENTTHYYTEEKLWGPLAWCSIPFVRKGIQQGFDEVARSLKERTESLFA